MSCRYLRGVSWGLAGIGPALAPADAEAHLATTRFGDFYAGVLHVGTAPEHVLALLALGLLTGLQEPRAGRWVLAAVPLGLLLGTSVAALAPSGTPVAAAAAIVLTLVGLLAAVAWPASGPAIAGLGLLVGLLHGYQNGLAVTDTTAAPLFVLGVVSCGLIALVLIAAAAVSVRERVAWGGIAVRAGGSWIAAIGVMMLGLSLA